MTNLASRIVSGKRQRKRCTVLYGVHGIGKTTWASRWDRPLFIAWEDGCADLDVASFRPNDLMDGWAMLTELGSRDSEIDCGTVVVDTADWMEAAIQTAVIQKKGKQSMADFEFGKGYEESASIFGKLLSMLSAIREADRHVLILAHCEISKMTEPGMESYDKYTPKLHKKTSALLQEWADEVLFARYETFVRKEDSGFGKSRGIASGGQNRVLHCQESAGWLAKNRLGLPAEMPFDFDEYAKFLN